MRSFSNRCLVIGMLHWLPTGDEHEQETERAISENHSGNWRHYCVYRLWLDLLSAFNDPVTPIEAYQ